MQKHHGETGQDHKEDDSNAYSIRSTTADTTASTASATTTTTTATATNGSSLLLEGVDTPISPEGLSAVFKSSSSSTSTTPATTPPLPAPAAPTVSAVGGTASLPHTRSSQRRRTTAPSTTSTSSTASSFNVANLKVGDVDDVRFETDSNDFDELYGNQATFGLADVPIPSIAESVPSIAESAASFSIRHEEATANLQPSPPDATRDRSWMERYNELVLYHQENGHSSVPNDYPPNKRLGHWVKRQRHQHFLYTKNKHSTMTKERKIQLEQIGFVWNSRDAIWEQHYGELVQFKRLHGHCKVPTEYAAKPSLGQWAKRQRREFRAYRESQEQQQELQAPPSPRRRQRRSRKNNNLSSSSQAAAVSVTTSSSDQQQEEKQTNMVLEKRFKMLQHIGFVFDNRGG